eukprot:SAG11_NODE_16342_length_550_cov_0.922395_1_plen_20_part_10
MLGSITNLSRMQRKPVWFLL